MLARLGTAILAPFAALAVLATVGAAGPAAAQVNPQGNPQGNPVVVELYTSQGCSSCPPADRLLARLARRDDVVALSLHVDYWDYLGWRDTFARHQFTERQYAYRDALGNNVVYTPQLIVHGHRAVPAEAGAMASAIQELGRRPRLIEVSIAKYRLSETVVIGRGENAGSTFTYHNVVNSLMRMGTWSGSEAEEVEMPHPDPGEGVAVWIQEGATGPILAAAKVENPAKQ